MLYSSSNIQFANVKVELALVIDTSAIDCGAGRPPRVTAFISGAMADEIDIQCGIDMGDPVEANSAVEDRICSSTAYGASECDEVVENVHRMDDLVAGLGPGTYCIGSTNSEEKDKLTCRNNIAGTQFDVVYTMIYLPHVGDAWCPPPP